MSQNVDRTSELMARLRRAAAAITDLEARLAAAQQPQREPVAIVGIGCRMPAGGSSPEAFWQALARGTDGVGPIPPERFSLSPRELAARPGARWGAFIGPVDGFDAAFFGISPREAATLDPQQRLLLEVAYEALEDAAIAPDRRIGTKTGVFVGVSTNDWLSRVLPEQLETLELYHTSGNGHFFPAGRLSYTLGLQGPSLVVDTACSSSLVAVHLAAQSLRSGESDLALAGGVNLILSPLSMHMVAATQALAPDGRCKTFDSRANGFVRGEGCGIIVLKRLSDAVRDGDRVLAVIRGSAVNQDGRSTGLTTPNVRAQVEMLRQALSSAGVSAADVGAIEAHGTGTPLGDPIEVEALAEVFGRAGETPCLLGSVKTNIGHLEAAAGIAGLLKLVLALRAKVYPPHLHLRALNPRIRLAGTRLTIPSALAPWPRGERPRIGGVSSFGLSGTNAHVLIEEAPEVEPRERSAVAPRVVLVSARSKRALERSLDRLSAALEAPDAPIDVDAVCATLAAGRSSLEERFAAVVQDTAGLKGALSRREGLSGRAARLPVALLFSGQGAQRLSMGKRLYETEASFRSALDSCFDAFSGELPAPLRDAMWSDGALLDRTEYTQAALFSLGVALAAWWRSEGISPEVLLGHSVGEVTAAAVSGALSLADAVKLVASRGRALASAPEGAMLAVQSDPASLRALTAEIPELSIAAENAPQSTVIAGPLRAIAAAEALLLGRSLRVRRLRTARAFHHALLDPVLPAFAAEIQGLSFREPQIPWISNVTGQIAGQEARTPRYWVEQIRSPVRFSSGLSAAWALGARVLVECGPDGGTLAMARETLPEARTIASLRREGDEQQVALGALAEAWVCGLQVRWPARLQGPRLSLPTYPWERERHWIESSAQNARSFQLFDSLPWLSDHRIDGDCIVPAAAHLPMLLRSALAGGHERPALVSVSFQRPLLLDGPTEIEVDAGAVGEEISLYSLGEPRVVHVAGRLAESGAAGQLSIAQVRADCPAPVDPADFHRFFRTLGFELGPSFLGLEAISAGEGSACGIIRAQPAPDGLPIHPGALDAALQLFAVALRAQSPGEAPVGERWLPFAVDRFEWYGGPALAGELFAVARSGQPSGDTSLASADIEICRPDGAIAARVIGLRTRRVTGALRDSELQRTSHQLRWEVVSEPPGALAGPWVVLADDRASIVTSALVGAGIELLHALPEPARPIAGVAVLAAGADAHLSLSAWLSSVQDLLRLPESVPVVWVTSGGAMDGHSPGDAALWGAVRSLRWEHPERPLRLVDLDPAEGGMEPLIAALRSREPEIAIRGGALHVSRLARASISARPWEPRPGTWLVTGGYGALGAHVAKLLARRSIRSIALAGRRRGEVPDLPGVEIHHRIVDLSVRADVEALIASLPDLAGVIHLAGVKDDAPVREQDATRAARVLDGKLAGAIHLDALLPAHVPLVAVSSLAAVTGSPGQTTYAAAGSALEAVIRARRARGGAGICVAFGPWQGAGMAEDGAQARQRLGIGALSPSLASLALGTLIASDLSEAVIASVDWERLAEGMGVLPWMSALVRARSPRAERISQGDAASIREQVIAAVASVLRTSPRALPGDRPLGELGMDSLMAVELRDALSRAVGRSLPASIAFDFPTIDTLAAHLTGDTQREQLVRESHEREPIAVIGMSGRYPGAPTLDALWALLDGGVDAIDVVPRERWDVQRWYDPDPEAYGKIYAREGGFLSGIDLFEPEFFGISPREARRMDPQQRLLLEVAYEALEDAGLSPPSLVGSRTGVFVGLCASEYPTRAADPLDIDAWYGTGISPSVAAGRLSYVFGLKGPAMTIDTACSSSLVTIHLAVQSLRNGESDLALAGGVNLILSPLTTLFFCKLRALSPTGRSRAFDDAADGYIRGEGVGLLALKRLSDAIRDGDPIRAVIRGSAINQDGRSAGLTAPNGPSQQAVIASALADAGLSPQDIDYVECHGTGTPLGDPIEVSALASALGEGRDAGSPVRIGSIKSNIGHLEGAAGVAGVTKVILALQRGRLPPSLHLRTPNRRIPWAELPVRPLTEGEPWEARVRRAGVSSFGFSGTNAHVVIESAPVQPPPEPESGELSLLVTSAASLDALSARVAGLIEALSAPSARLGDIAYTSARRRALYAHRAAVVAKSPSEAAERLSSLPLAPLPEPVRQGGLVFVFPGHGAQRPGMGLGLYDTDPSYRSALSAVDAEVRALSQESVLSAIRSEGALDRIDLAQPALLAVGIALAAWYQARGIVPDALVGHSLGEVVAAHVGGALSLRDAVRVIVVRSRALRSIAGRGAMAVIDRGAGELSLPEGLEIAVEQSRRSSVVAGQPARIEAWMAEQVAAGRFCKRVAVDVASHTSFVEPILDEVRQALSDLEPMPTRIPIFSSSGTSAGKAVDGRSLGAEYWVENLRRTVQFASAIEGAIGAGHHLFVECSPHPVLAAAIEEVAAGIGEPVRTVASLRRDLPDDRTALEGIAALIAAGRTPRWESLVPERRVVPLQAYPFQRSRHWIDEGPSATPTQAQPTHAHPLLGPQVSSSLDPSVTLFERTLSARTEPWLGDHEVAGEVILPGAATLEIALAAAGEGWSIAGATLDRVVPIAPGGTLLQAALVRRGEAASVRVSWRAAGGFVSAARVDLVRARPEPVPPPLAAEGAGEEIAAETLYRALAARGLSYGPRLRAVRSLRSAPGLVIADLYLSEAIPLDAFALHPAALDAALQAVAGSPDAPPGLWLPSGVGQVRLFGPGSREATAVIRINAGPEESSLDITLYRSDRSPWFSVEGLRTRRVEGAALTQLAPIASIWRPIAPDAPALPEPRWEIRGEGPLAEAARAHLAGAPGGGEGEGVILVLPEAQSALEARRGLAWAIEQLRPLLAASPPPRVVVISRGAAGPSPARPLQGYALGLVRTLAIEAPALRASIVDLDPEELPSARASRWWGALSVAGEIEILERGGALSAARLAPISPSEPDQARAPAVIRQAPCAPPGDREVRITLRDGELLESGLWRVGGEVEALGEGVAGLALGEAVQVEIAPCIGARITLPVSALRGPPEIRAGRAYLVTGGLGGLGLCLAEHLIERGAVPVLLSRSAPGGEALDTLSRWRQRAARVEVLQADVSSRAEVDRAVSEVDALGLVLGGLFHLAGALDDALLSDIGPRQLQAVWDGKVCGAFHLHEALIGRPIELFVLFSSASGALGSPGQAHYAAANTALDSLAAWRRAQGLPATSIAWGTWASVGLASARRDRGDRLVGFGIRPLVPAAALSALPALLASRAPAPLLVDADWAVVRRSGSPGAAARLSLLAPDAPSEELRALPWADRVPEVLRTAAAFVMQIPKDSLSEDLPLRELGMDSLMAAQIRGAVERELGVTLSIAALLRGASLRELASELLASGEPGSADEAPGAFPEVTLASRNQAALWFLQRLEPSSSAYNVAFAWKIRQAIDLEALRGALVWLVARHASLGEVFEERDGALHRRPGRAPLGWQVIAASEAEIEARIAEESERPFDLAEGPLLRASVFSRSREDHTLLVVVHHACFDVWSLVVLRDELQHAYGELSSGRAPSLPREGITFGQFVAWQERWLKTPAARAQIAAWREALAGAPPLALHTDKKRPAAQRFRGETVPFELPEPLTRAVRERAAALGVTPYVVLLSALFALLRRSSGQRDIVIGSPMSGRTRAELEGLVGYLTNAVALRATVDGELSFGEIVAQVQSVALAAMDRQGIPFPVVVEQSSQEREPGRTPLFQVLFVREKAQRRPPARVHLAMQSVPVLPRSAPFELSLMVVEEEDEGAAWPCRLQYDSDLFDPKTARRFAERYQRLLEGALQDLAAPIDHLSLETPEDAEVRARFLAPSRPFPRLRLESHVPRQAAQTPDAEAVSDGGFALSFAELSHRSEQIAAHLVRAGVRPGDRVALVGGWSSALVAGLVGVLRAGAAWVPIDPRWPEARARALLEDTGAAAVIAEDGAPVSAASLPVLRLGAPLEAIAPPPAPDDPSALAYVLYTSGSTGRPKGVRCRHAGVVNLLSDIDARAPIGPGDRAALWTSPSFDVSVYDLFSALLVGASVAIVPEEVRLDGARYARWLVEERIASAYVAPFHLEALLAELRAQEPGAVSLRRLIVGVEPIPYELLVAIIDAHPGLVIVNGYGPTETSICATLHTIDPRSPRQGSAPIGRPVQNTRVAVTDARGREVPVGIPGEIRVAGVGLAEGYHGDEIRTAERFVVDGEGVRWYLTGDIGRIGLDGELEFLGRADRQIKVRGYRVEPGEIEAVLAAHPGVSECAVIIEEGARREDRRLLAAVVPREGGALPEDLQAYLRAHLPSYMVPARCFALPALPRTASDKIDRKAIVPPADEGHGRTLATDLERALAESWRVLLGAPIRADDDFFASGGHSLIAVTAASEASKIAGIEVPVRWIFESPAVSALAERIEAVRAGRPALARLPWADDLTTQPLPSLSGRIAADRPARRVLVTGATGYLGSHVVAALLSREDVSVRCLVRAPSQEQAMARLSDALIRIGVRLDPARVTAEPADLSAPALGLSPDRFRQIPEEIDAIVHSAADVHFLKPYEALRAANVRGTQEILALAAAGRGRLPLVLQISTLAVFPTAGGPWRESDRAAPPEALETGYAQSKAVAEGLARRAREAGLPVVCVRPGRIAGHSTTGDFNAEDLFARVLQGSIALGAAPDLDARIDLTPVDYAASAIVELLTSAGALPEVVHLVNPGPLPAERLFEWVRSAGYDVQRVSYGEWTARIARAEDNPLKPFLDLLREPPQEPSFDAENARLLSASCPPVDGPLLSRWLDSLASKGLIPTKGGRL